MGKIRIRTGRGTGTMEVEVEEQVLGRAKTKVPDKNHYFQFYRFNK